MYFFSRFSAFQSNRATVHRENVADRRFAPLKRVMRTDTNWESIGRTLQQIVERCRELGAAPDLSWTYMAAGDLGIAMRIAEAKVRPVCDELLHELVKPGGVMGRPSQAVMYFCCLRGLCALDTLGIFHAELNSRPLYPHPPHWPSRDLLEWLLVSNWEQRHDTWLKLCAYAVTTGNPFYSG